MRNERKWRMVVSQTEYARSEQGGAFLFSLDIAGNV